MELAFENKELREICEDSKKATNKLGEELSISLRRRLSDIRAAKNIQELPIGNPMPFENENGSFCKISLQKGHELVFCCNHIYTPKGGDDNIDWSLVRRIKLLEIKKLKNE